MGKGGNENEVRKELSGDRREDISEERWERWGNGKIKD